MTRTDLAYRKTAAEGANGFGLLTALFDTLAGDLRRAAEAQQQNDIEWRCREVKHALVVIGHLENWVQCGTGGKLAEQLAAFYAMLRRKLLEAQAKQSAEVLRQQMTQVLEVREYWQRVDVNTTPSNPEFLLNQPPRYAGYQPMQSEQRRSSWSV